jgi:hypothetical protein
MHSPHKSQFLLDYMIANEVKDHDGNKKKRQVRYSAPGTQEEICSQCFAHAAGYVTLKTGMPSITFKRVQAAFNQGDSTIDFRVDRGRKRRTEFAMAPRIVAWVRGWLPGNHDKSPMDPDELHLNARSLGSVWVLCCEQFVKDANLGPNATEAEKNSCR